MLDPTRAMLVATAKKGVGKSALLRWAEGKLRESSPGEIIVRCRGADLARSRFGFSSQTTSPNDRIREWMVRLCTVVNRIVAQRIGFAVKDDHVTLVEAAEIDGFKGKNIIGSLLDRFGRSIPGINVDKRKIIEEVEILRRTKPNVWIFIDDLDATFQNTEEEILELSTFFSAMRYLTQDVSGFRFRVTLRTDVWPVIRRHDEALDKIDQYVKPIEWTREEFRQILEKRVRAQLSPHRRQIVQSRGLVDSLLDEQEWLNYIVQPKMPWADKEVPSHQVLYTLSYQRPRWGIQLCKLAQAAALREGIAFISKSHVDAVWGDYGTRRIADLVVEHKHQCREIQELITSFRGSPREFTRDELFDWVNKKVLPHVHVVIEGVHTRASRDIARFLYRVGFILARSSSDDGYEHYSFDQMPDFLDNKTNHDFGVTWEIHPCYREALDIRKVDQAHREKFGELRKRR